MANYYGSIGTIQEGYLRLSEPDYKLAAVGLRQFYAGIPF